MMDSIFFISDIDGTIYREKKVTEEELFFLNSVSKRYPIVLATGRNYAMFHRFIQEYSFEYEYCILNNGALVMDKKRFNTCKLKYENQYDITASSRNVRKKRDHYQYDI
ncbi:HAD family hydrolase [Enterococcus mundtii]|uniref:HAD family hydrolase n=1 Tax=Enterococcus mundtii TaxID=53346 RepID=UPI000CF0A7BF|nr:HAD hydrolase family protein [Enterococcus mundtii]PQC30593.1 hypothetical protein CUM97_08645 [Enterococcus mundtii]